MAPQTAREFERLAHMTFEGIITDIKQIPGDYLGYSDQYNYPVYGVKLVITDTSLEDRPIYTIWDFE